MHQINSWAAQFRIRIKEQHISSRAGLETQIVGSREAKVPRATDQLQIREALAQDPARIVGGSVVNDDDFKIQPAGERTDTLDAPYGVAGGIPVDDNDRQIHTACRTRSQSRVKVLFPQGVHEKRAPHVSE